MGLFSKNKTTGLMDEIRCDEPSYLIWKWHPSGSQRGESNRENAIRWGSSLRVKDGEVAIFVYKQKDGLMQDYIVGPFDQTIKTTNFPVLSSMIGLVYDGASPFQAEVYFINLARIVQIKFAVPYFNVYDPRFLDYGVPVAVRGTVSFRIDDYEAFIKLHRLSSFNLEDFQKQIKDAVNRYVKDKVANAPSENGIPVVQIETKIAQINDVIEDDLSERLNQDFGVVVSRIDIGVIEIDKSSEGYLQLMAVTRQLTEARMQAQTEAYVKNVHDMQRIEAENYQELLRVQREEGQYAKHKQTQTSNFAAYQTEAQTEVGVAGASALGQMGANGAGSVDLGGSGTGFNPAAMMAGVALGGAVGQNIAGTMSHLMMGNQSQSVLGTTPPPIPVALYHVVVNGQATGPYDTAAIKQMIANGTVTKESLVWKQGMAEWLNASSVQELQALFEIPVPPIVS